MKYIEITVALMTAVLKAMGFARVVCLIIKSAYRIVRLLFAHTWRHFEYCSAALALV